MIKKPKNSLEVRIISNVIEVQDLKKVYSLGQVKVNALSGINMKVPSGDFVAILGPSGSGKTTLLHSLGALDKPTSGSVLIFGSDLALLNDSQLTELRRKIGFVFQFFNLIPRLTALENVELPLSIVRVPKKVRRKRAIKLLETVGLGDRIHHNPLELSGGERQRVALARALANKPDFLLMDEPTGNIDSKTASELLEIITTLNRENLVTTIMVTHDHEIAKYAKRILHFKDGLILKEEVNS